MTILKGRTPTGIRSKIPSGYVLGRESGGDGQPELIKLSNLGGGKGRRGADGAAGANGTPAPAAVATFIQGTMANLEKVMVFITATAYSLPINLTGSQAKAKTASTNDVSFDIQKNGASIGSIRFNVSATGSFTFASGVSFAVGDTVELVGPTTRDPTLADISVTLLGSY